MARWTLQLSLDEDSGTPLFLRIVQAIIEAIRQGRLKAGDPLPGHRVLADSLGVNRNTVLAAYQELIAEGVVSTKLGAGTFISQALPKPVSKASLPNRLAKDPSLVGFDLEGPGFAHQHPPAKSLSPAWVVNTGMPDPRLFPTNALIRAYRRAMQSRRGEALIARDPQGAFQLRAELAKMLTSTRGIPDDPERVIITRGSQMASFLVADALLGPGDLVAVEALGSMSLWNAIAQSGAEMVPIPVDQDGMNIDNLERLVKTRRVRAVFLTPHRQYPTTVPLSANRRLHLMALAALHRLAIVELEYDSELQFEAPPRLSLASQDPIGVVVHVGTLSKVLSPSFRLGYLFGPAPVISKISQRREFFDGQGDSILEVAMAELIADGELQRHINRVRRTYQSRRDALIRALHAELGNALCFQTPDGGVALWGSATEGVDVISWAMNCLEHGVLLHPGNRYAFNKETCPATSLRIGFSRYSETELAIVAREMAKALN